MKKRFLLLFSAFLCSALFFTACSGRGPEKNEGTAAAGTAKAGPEIMIDGKWVQDEIDGQPAATNDKRVFTFLSAGRASVMEPIGNYSEPLAEWDTHHEYDVRTDGSKVTLTAHPAGGSAQIMELDVTSITDSEMVCRFKPASGSGAEQSVRFVKTGADYKEDIIGIWEGGRTSESSVFDDDENHRWEYKTDGTFVYYLKDGDNWVPSGNTMNEYFVDGPLLCTRWGDNGTESREWWEITVAGDSMNWTALRKNEDGTTFTASFAMTRVPEKS